MNKSIVITIISILLFGIGSFAQTIQNIDPVSAVPGDAVTISVIGTGTHFKQGATKFVFSSSDVDVLSTTVYSPSTASAFVRVNASAKVGGITLIIQTGAESTKPLPFNIIAVPNAGVMADMEVLPVQSISISDFDVNHLNTAPLIFDVTVDNYNPTVLSGATAKLEINGQQYGNVLTATKLLSNIAANGGVLKFTNRDFDNYSLNTANTAFINNSTQTGVIPSDAYSYKITIFTKNGTNVASANGINVITNPGPSGLYLISPGTPLNVTPGQISEANPLFQWFSSESSFDMYLYEVKPGQVSASDITSNTPIYYSKGLSTSSLTYPLSALQLKQGSTYAWQVISHSYTSHGDQATPSPVFWFSLGAGGNINSAMINKIEVTPADIQMSVNDTFSFTATAYDNQEQPLPIKPVWSVVPAAGGTVDASGKFIAGSAAMEVAVIARFGDKEEYATVNIGLGAVAWDFDAFFRQVFGLPTIVK